MIYFDSSFRRHIWLLVAALCVWGVLGCGASTVRAAGGDLDASFLNRGTGANNQVQALAVQPDGKIVIGGQFTQVNEVGRNRMASRRERARACPQRAEWRVAK